MSAPSEAMAVVQPARQRLAAIRRPVAIVSAAFLLSVILACLAAPLLAPYNPTTVDLGSVLTGPTAEHWLGTDRLGRDVLSRLLFGGRISLAGVAQAVIVFLAIGVPAGLTAGFLGGWWDRTVSWIADIALALPGILILLVVLGVFGSNETAAMVTLGLLGAPGLARVVRSAALTVRNELYIAAARVAGLPDRRIIARQVLPRVLGPIVVRTSIFAGASLLTETGIGYLGLGVPPPTPTWGGMVAEASQVIDRQPWLLVPTGLTIGLTVLAFGLLGDAVRDATAPASQTTSQPRRRRDRRPSARPPGSSTTVPGPPAGSALLELVGVSIAVPADDGLRTVIEDVDLTLHAGETVGLIGESGCGKTLTGRSILGLPHGGEVVAGQVIFQGHDLTSLPQRDLRRLRGSEIALVSQEPTASLDPVFTVGQQIGELVRRHRGGTRRAAQARTRELLGMVRLPDPEQVMGRYPHELSGGMAQRVGIALALAGSPRLLIADEPTTALDVTVQAEILDLLRDLCDRLDMAVLLITHDWGVVADLCQRAYVMYAGHVMESATVDEMFTAPRHPYTHGLFGSIPRRRQRGEDLPAIPGTVPNALAWPSGCRFHPRCPLATAECAEGSMPVFHPTTGHETRCLHYEDVVTLGAK